MSREPHFKPKGYYSRPEVAALLKVPIETIRYMERKGKLSGTKFDMAGNRVFYKAEDVIELKKEIDEKY